MLWTTCVRLCLCFCLCGAQLGHTYPRYFISPPALPCLCSPWTPLLLTTHAAPVHTRLSLAIANSQVSANFPSYAVFRFSAMSALQQPQASTGTPVTPAPDAPTLANYTGYERFPRPAPRVQPIATFGKSKPEFHGPLSDAKSDLLHAQYRLSLLHWNAGAARRQAPQLVTAMCGAFNAVLLQEAHDHVSHISDQFILLNKDTFLPDAVKYPIIEESTSKTTWGLKALVICGHLRRPPAGASKTVTFCTVHLHNVVAEKRDAATSLLQRLYAHMKRLEVDFVGGDCNMAVKGSVADVFSDPEFMASGSSPLWGAGGLEGDNEDCTGFLCMPRRPFHWFVNKHGVHTFSDDQLGLNERDESTHYPVFMHLWATNLLGGTRAALRSDAAQAKRLLKAATKNERKRHRRLNHAAASKVDPTTSTATAGKSHSAPPTSPV